MKQKIKSGVVTFSVLGCLVLSLAAVISLHKDYQATEAITIPTTINLNDNTDEEIRDYYSYLNDLPDSERRGQNLLKNLKYILVNNPSNPTKKARYFTYAQDRSIYKITDRNWYSAPASGISGYNATTKTITGYSYSSEDPYLYYYYRDDNFTNPHKFSDKVTSAKGSTETLLNQEHIWSKSHGFSESSGVPNAGSDLHHLVAADVAVNKWGHSNYSYGYVDTESSDWSSTKVNWDNGANAILNNKLGTPLNPHANDEGSSIFEPRDEDKGDFARALLYMVARYNYIGDSTSVHSIEEPNLELVDWIIDSSINCSTSSDVAQYGKLSDILAFHKQDPVITGTNQDFEVHRNNIIYNNYQYTRNPFIDFPEWVDLIWGEKKETGVARPETDTINGYNANDAVSGVSLTPASLTVGKGKTASLTATVVPSTAADKAVTFTSSNSTIATVNSSGVVTGVKDGTCTITVTTHDGGYTATSNITVQTNAPSVTSVTLNKNVDSIDLEDGDTINLIATVTGENTPPTTVNWTSSNDSVASVDSSGVVTCKKNGTVIITATSTFDSTKSASCTITITDTRAVETYTVTITKDDYTAGNGGDAGTSGSIVKTVNSANDLTINYGGINTQSAGGSAYSYTMYSKGNGFIYSNTAISGYYPSNIIVTFNSGTAVSGKAGISFGSSILNSRDDTVSGAVTKGGTCELSNADSSKVYWNFSTKTDNVRVDSIVITYSLIGGDAPTPEPIDVTGVTVSPSVSTLTEGDTLQLTATVAPTTADEQAVLWSTSDASVATVDEDGLVTAQGEGSATITATTVDGGFTDICNVTVNPADMPAVNSVTVSPAAVQLDLSSQTSANLTATVDAVNGAPTTVNWSSTNSNVATVSSSGVVTAVAAGSANIIATSTFDGTKSGSCSVIVQGGVASNKYTLASDLSDIVPGATVIFVGLHTDGNMIMGAEQQTGTNKAYSRIRTAVTVTDNQVSDASAGVTFTVGLNQYGYYFKDDTTNKYLDASLTTASSHQLHSTETLDNEGLTTYWTVTYTSETWHVTSKSISTEEIRYYKHSSNGRFSCYNAGAQTKIGLFVYNKEMITNQERIDAFSYNFMRKGETLSDSDTGACKGENGYFAKAKAALETAVLNNGWATVSTIFGSDTSGMWNRYVAWGKANGYDVTFSSSSISYNSLNYNPAYVSGDTNINYIVVVFAVISLSSISILIIIKKKRKR